ncbi:hypothetical protein RZR97_08390 [Hydrogenimonas thermophila]|uniref:hypothetical protein n=1 Tax=Hydrogenimonas thermophila TaxID=223786 RepID=UPI002936D8FB|nr:hypothetical protein [Hydrogenimonas thermophila]WOE69126.1 hypothetical protein RZR91_08415 [Hydrogenimonas thermophila]WOE71636.1 hypothetical protein RZR97_08390 [Hydrogenimonas thermophila]
MNNNNNEGQIGIEKIEGIIERLYQKMIQIQNINFFHTDFPDTIDFKGVHPVANWGKAFLFIFAIPVFLLVFFSKEIIKWIGTFLGLHAGSSNLEILIFAIVIYFSSALFVLLLYKAYDLYTKKNNVLKIDENRFKFKKIDIKIEQIFYCFQHRLAKNKITIYYKDLKKGFLEASFRMRNGAEAYAVCTKIKEIKIKKENQQRRL